MSKKNLILGGILILLIAIAYVYQGPWRSWRNGLTQPKNVLAQVDFDSIDKIEINQEKNNLVLEKKDKEWKLSGSTKFLLQKDISEKITGELSSLAKAEVEIISNNKNNKKDYSTDDKGINMKIFSGKEQVADFIIGRSDGQANYISMPDSDNTFSYKYDIRSFFGNTDNWYDKTIFSSKKEDINRLRLQYPDSEFSIEKNKIWEGIKPYRFTVNEQKLTKILDIMSNLNAVSIPVQNFKDAGLDKTNSNASSLFNSKTSVFFKKLFIIG